MMMTVSIKKIFPFDLVGSPGFANAKIMNESLGFVEDKIWKTKERIDIPVVEMEDSHIENCMKMLDDSEYRRTHWFSADSIEEWLEIFRDELNRRKELERQKKLEMI